jgi:hypothetical protein
VKDLERVSKASRFYQPGFTVGKSWAEGREDKGGLGWFLSPLRFRPVSAPEHPTQAGSLCYNALRSVERSVEMLSEASSAHPESPRDGVV